MLHHLNMDMQHDLIKNYHAIFSHFIFLNINQHILALALNVFFEHTLQNIDEYYGERCKNMALFMCTYYESEYW